MINVHPLAARLLNRLGILKFLVARSPIRINKSVINIPLIGGTGFANLYAKPGWLSAILTDYIKEKDLLFVDVGANLGQTMIEYQSIGRKGRYLGFELNPQCTEYLNFLVRLNDWQDKVRLISTGLYNNNMIIKLYQNRFADSGASVHPGLRPGYFRSANYMYAPVITLDGFIDDISKEADVLMIAKIDVEGAELEVLEGMINTIENYRPVLILEVLDYFSEEVKVEYLDRSERLMKMLKEFNYRVYNVLSGMNGKKKLELNEVQSFELRQWNPESRYKNDYLCEPI